MMNNSSTLLLNHKLSYVLKYTYRDISSIVQIPAFRVHYKNVEDISVFKKLGR
jgi:hypothetical protein